MIPIYTIATTSHLPLLQEWFLKTLPKGFDPKVKTIKSKLHEKCFSTDLYKKGVIEKTKYIIEALESSKFGIFADCDICFFSKTSDELLHDIAIDKEMVLQYDTIDLPCTGFFLFNSSDKLIKLWKSILIGVESNKFFGDGDGFLFNSSDIDYDILPKEFDSYYRHHGFDQIEDPSIENKNIKIYHANNGKDVRSKMFLLKKVWDLVYST